MNSPNSFIPGSKNHIRFIIYKRSHGFSVHCTYEQDRRFLTNFNKQLEVYGSRYDRRARRVIRELKLVYSTWVSYIGLYGLHISLYNEFRDYLKNIGASDNSIEVIENKTVVGAVSNIELSEIAKPKDYQEPIINYVVEDGFTKIIKLQGGKGKTFCSLYAIALIKIRTVIILEATLVEVWLNDMSWIYNNSKEETIIVKGNKELKNMIRLGLNNEIKHSIIIISVGTIRDYLTEYEETGKSTYGCLPSELYNVLNVGFRITDEAHSNLHFHFRHDIETSVSKSLYLSATLKSNDPTINKMFNIIFPPQYRCKELDWDKYAIVTSVAYTLREPHKAKYMGSMGYSHIEFEKYLLKNKTKLYNYLELIIYLVNSRFIQKNLPDQKLMIFAASVDMCDIIAKFLIKELKDDGMKIAAYTGEHEDVVLHNNTIVVTTLKKSGKGKDLKRLTTVINTVSIMARELNEQAFLRLRRIDNFYPGIDPEFITLVCLDIKKQKDYHDHRLEIFRPLSKRMNNFRSSFII